MACKQTLELQSDDAKKKRACTSIQPEGQAARVDGLQRVIEFLAKASIYA